MKKTIKIEGMTCEHCAGRVKKKLEKICGVIIVDVSVEKKRAIVELAYEVDEANFEAVVEEVGYKVVGIE